MSNENPNNTPRWRNKLDELEHFPGSAFNGNAAWDKLHGCLQGNKKSKKIYWYWIAAACLLFGVMITILNHQKITPPASNRETVKEQSKEIRKSVLKPEEAHKIETGNGAEIIKNKMVATSSQPVRGNHRVVPTKVPTKVQSNDVMVNNPEQEPVAKSLQIVNNNSTTATVPPKKKLNVVHINELGDPVMEIPDMAGKMGKHPFKLGSGEMYANPSTVYKNTDFTILKTKL